MLAWVLMVVAAICNLRDAKMLGTLGVVCISKSLSPPMQSYEAFYFFCILSEICVALIAFLLRSSASTSVIIICMGLVVMHISGAVLDGYPPMSPYHIIVPILEHAEIIVCIILSKPLLGMVRNHESTPI